ncbi:hypothetical protein GTW46_12575 [Streptomyces sp. SID6013]|nr:hypothetical protein [Streptomyces sp. SID6013]
MVVIGQWVRAFGWSESNTPGDDPITWLKRQVRTRTMPVLGLPDGAWGGPLYGDPAMWPGLPYALLFLEWEGCRGWRCPGRSNAGRGGRPGGAGQSASHYLF